MCLGCGACAYIGEDAGVRMQDYPGVGRRPLFPAQLPAGMEREMVSACPGVRIESPLTDERAGRADENEILIGPTEGIWEGWASDSEIRFSGSSGGAVTGLALFCLERLGMAFVVHSGMDPEKPWLTKTVVSRSRSDLLGRCGSRYSPSSPVEALRLIERSDAPCVFIGKPCDAAAVNNLRRFRPDLDAKLGLVLSFFCAGPPSSGASVKLAASLGIEPAENITSLKYRGKGWPGNFEVRGRDGREASLSYDESWGILAQKQRQLRCHLCPDGLGELSDVTGGDAWHRRAEGSDGISLVLARTARGRDAVAAAMAAGYLNLKPSDAAAVVKAQGLVGRRKLVGARIKALKLFGLPVPEFPGFFLDRASAAESLPKRIKEFTGMAKRILVRGYLKPEPRE